MEPDRGLAPPPVTVDRRFYTKTGEQVVHRTDVGHLALIIRRREAMIAEGFTILEDPNHA